MGVNSPIKWIDGRLIEQGTYDVLFDGMAVKHIGAQIINGKRYTRVLPSSSLQQNPEPLF
jgi:hypothetical protein